jgi:hypothetical protein
MAEKNKSFKLCAGCPTPSKCKAAGKCLMKGKAMAGKSMKDGGVAIIISAAKPTKKPAKKK